jgi:hypothetical protein
MPFESSYELDTMGNPKAEVTEDFAEPETIEEIKEEKMEIIKLKTPDESKRSMIEKKEWRQKAQTHMVTKTKKVNGKDVEYMIEEEFYVVNGHEMTSKEYF